MICALYLKNPSNRYMFKEGCKKILIKKIINRLENKSCEDPAGRCRRGGKKPVEKATHCTSLIFLHKAQNARVLNKPLKKKVFFSKKHLRKQHYTHHPHLAL